MALGFLFGGDTNETPESIRRKRQIAQALLASQGAPRNVGEGLNALGDGIVSAVMNSRADKAEKTGMESAANDFAPLVSGFGGSSATPGATGSSMPKVDASGNVALPSGGDLPSSFLAAVDKTEGAGGYDTLYGNAQKGGQFAGTSVSGMPIRDVLAFTDPNGAYAQSVKGKIGRVATPVGRYQVVGTTLRNAVNDMGLDPNAPFDQATQDKIAAHLARSRIASASTPEGKIAALRSEWHGFRNVPDAQMRQIVADIENGKAPAVTAPPTEVASLDPSSGMPPVSPIQPPVIPPSTPTPGYIDPAVTTNGQQPQPPAPAPTPNPGQAPSPVAAALAAPQKGGRLGMPQQPLSDADFNSRFGADDTGAIPPQVGPQSTLPPLPVTEVGPTPNVASVPPVGNEQGSGKRPVTVAQALINGDRSNAGMGGDAPGAGYFPAAPNAGGQSGPSQEQILKVLTNPYASDSQKAVANALLKRSMDASDPDSQLDREYKRAQLDALKAKPQKAWQKLTDTLLFNPETGETKDITGTPAGEKPKFRYQGNSVEAQSLNGLMDAGTITPDQAQQLGAGKTITGPNGEIIFMTPQGVFGKPADGGAAQPLSAPQEPIDLFGDGGSSIPAPAPSQAPATSMPSAGPAAAAPSIAPSPSATPPITPSAPEQRPGMIPLTQGKPEKPPTESQQKNRSLYSVIKPELKTVEDNFDALTDPKNQAFARMPFNEFVTTPEYQQAANSLQTIISSYLYSVSGATATPDEVKKQTDMLTPKPMESKESIENKKRRIRNMVNAVAQSGGLPPEEAPAASGNSADLNAARDAIAKGAPRDKVMKRLQDAGIDPTGL